MSLDALLGAQALPVDAAQRIDRICDRFETAWKDGERPAVEAYLEDATEPDRTVLLCELVALDLSYRRQSENDEPTFDEYALRFPGHHDALQAVFKHDKTDHERIRSGPAAPTRPYSVDGGFDQKRVAPEPNLVGNMLGEYELLEKIGHGGMGLVYRARDTRINRIVALKLIRPNLADELGPSRYKNWLERFRREAQLTAHLEHDDIVPVYAVSEWNGQPFFTMRYIDGLSLSQRIRSEAISERHGAGYVERIARAVAYAHRHGVLHRDIKPSNILIDAGDHPYVTDFGLAKWVEGTSGLTEADACIGSPPYMPPEQVRNASNVSVRSDVYGLGATLYDVLTGRPPFRASRIAETLHQVLHYPPVPPRRLNPAIDRDLETITLKCLDKDPRRRYATADDLADDLHRYLEGRPIQARPAGVIEKAWRWCRRYPVTAALTTAVAVLMLTILCLAAYGYFEVSRAWEQTMHERDEAREAARTALLEKARTARLSATAGRRWQALDALRQAAAIRPGPDLRDEYLRCLDLADIRRVEAPNLTTVQKSINDKTEDQIPVSASPNGRYLITRSRAENRSFIVDMHENDARIELTDSAGRPVIPHAVAFSPKSDVCALAFEPTDGQSKNRGHVIHIFRPNGGNLILIGDWHVDGSGVDSLCFNSNATLLAASADLRETHYGLRLWDVEARKETTPLELEPAAGWRGDLWAPRRIAFSPDGRFVAAARGTAKLWDLSETPPRAVWSKSLDTRPAEGIYILPDSRWVVTVDGAHGLTLWDALGKGNLVVHGADDMQPSDFTDVKAPNAVVSIDAPRGDVAESGLWEFAAPISRLYAVPGLDLAKIGRPQHFSLALSPDEKWLAFAFGAPDENGPFVVDLTQAHAAPSALKQNGGGMPRLLTFNHSTTQLWSSARRRPMTWQLPEMMTDALEPEGTVVAAAYGESGRVVGRLVERNHLSLVDLASGTLRWKFAMLNATNGAASRPVFSRTGQLLMTGLRRSGAADSPTIQVWNVSDGTLRLQDVGDSGHFFFENEAPYSVVDTRSLAIRALNGDQTSAQAAQPKSTFENYQLFGKLAFSNDGHMLAECGLSGEMAIWELTNGRLIRRCQIVRHRPESFLQQDLRAFSHDGSKIAAFDGTADLKVWDTRTGRELARWPIDVRPELFAFSPDDKHLWLVSLGREVREWSLDGAAPRRLCDLSASPAVDVQRRLSWWNQNHLHIADAISLSADGSALVYASPSDGGTAQTVCVWQIPAGTLTTTVVPIASATPAKIGLDSTGSALAISATAVDVEVADVSTGAIFARIPCPEEEPHERSSTVARLLRTVSLSANGTHAAWMHQVKDDWRIYVKKLADAGEPHSMQLKEEPRSLTLAAHGRRLALGTKSGGIVYDLSNHSALELQSDAGQPLDIFAFDACASRVAAASRSNGDLYLWNAENGQRLAKFSTNYQNVWCVGISASGRWLAAVVSGGHVRVWDILEVQRRLTESNLAWE